MKVFLNYTLTCQSQVYCIDLLFPAVLLLQWADCCWSLPPRRLLILMPEFYCTSTRKIQWKCCNILCTLFCRVQDYDYSITFIGFPSTISINHLLYLTWLLLLFSLSVLDGLTEYQMLTLMSKMSLGWTLGSSYSTLDPSLLKQLNIGVAVISTLEVLCGSYSYYVINVMRKCQWWYGDDGGDEGMKLWQCWCRAI